MRFRLVPVDDEFFALFSASARNAASAGGERQMLPRQTNRTEVVMRMSPRRRPPKALLPKAPALLARGKEKHNERVEGLNPDGADR